MARICAQCGKEIGFFEDCLTLSGVDKTFACKECRIEIESDIESLATIKSIAGRERAIEEFVQSSKYNEAIMSCIEPMAHKRALDLEPSIQLSITAGHSNIGVSKFFSTTTMKQTSEGYVYFQEDPGRLLLLDEYSWDGPRYQTVTTSKETGKSKDKGKTKRKGGIGGAAIGTLLMPGVGTAIGYAATSKKVNKGKGKTAVNTVINENQEEIDGQATIRFKEPDTGKTFSIGIKCNSNIDIELDSFDWSAANEDTGMIEVDVSSAEPAATKDTPNEMDRIAALKQYKELLDLGIITQEEFDAKKKELLG